MFINGVGQGAPGGNRIFMTIWDGNGTDTYDFSNYTTSVTVDLTPGGFSITSETQRASLGAGNKAPGNIFNALQFNGDARSLIENVIARRPTTRSQAMPRTTCSVVVRERYPAR